MSKLRHHDLSRRPNIVALASLLLVLAQFSLILHNISGESHPMGEVCQICVQLHGGGHALAPSTSLSPVITALYLRVVFSTDSLILDTPVQAARPRGPPLH